MGTTYIALLRAVNVGGNKKVAMGELRDVVTEIGFTDVRSWIQSGNLIFRGKTKTTAAVEQALEQEIERRLGVATDFMVRTAAEWESIIAGNPFPDAAQGDPSHLLVMCLKSAPGQNDVEALRAAIKGRETVEAKGKQAYIIYRDGIGTSRLTIAIIEKKLGTRATGRNWNTVVKLASLAGVAGK